MVCNNVAFCAFQCVFMCVCVFVCVFVCVCAAESMTCLSEITDSVCQRKPDNPTLQHYVCVCLYMFVCVCLRVCVVTAHQSSKEALLLPPPPPSHPPGLWWDHLPSYGQRKAWLTCERSPPHKVFEVQAFVDPSFHCYLLMVVDMCRGAIAVSHSQPTPHQTQEFSGMQSELSAQVLFMWLKLIPISANVWRQFWVSTCKSGGPSRWWGLSWQPAIPCMLGWWLCNWQTIITVSPTHLDYITVTHRYSFPCLPFFQWTLDPFKEVSQPWRTFVSWFRGQFSSYVPGPWFIGQLPHGPCDSSRLIFREQGFVGQFLFNLPGLGSWVSSHLIFQAWVCGTVPI